MPKALAKTLVADEGDVDILTDTPIEDDLSAEIENDMVATTVNICPNSFMNKKRWSDYDHDQQRNILRRIEKAFRVKHPSVELLKMAFEICPTLDNIHFHCLYKCPLIFKSTIENYFKKYSPKKGGDTWRTVIVKEIFDEEGWIKYISKDITL